MYINLLAIAYPFRSQQKILYITELTIFDCFIIWTRKNTMAISNHKLDDIFLFLFDSFLMRSYYITGSIPNLKNIPAGITRGGFQLAYQD